MRIEDVPALKARVIEGDQRGFMFGRKVDIDAHLDGVRRDFVGRPELCFEHAKLIILLRRGVDVDANFQLFQALWSAHGAFLIEHLDTRWLVSACDTFADHGAPAQRAPALLLVTMIKLMKLVESERMVLADATIDAEKLQSADERTKRGEHQELWDGVTAYWLRGGDLPRNMFTRILDVCGGDATLTALARALIDRAVAHDTLFGRLSKLNPRFLPAELAIASSDSIAAE